jgi:general secretion pathway protein L
MAAICYLRLQDEQHIDYLITGDEGSEPLAGSAFHNDQLPAFPAGLKTILVLPGTDVLQLSVNMPKTHRSQLEKALPFALEEQLIDEVSELHFVAGKQDDEGNVSVAIIKKALLTKWLAVCLQLGLHPQLAVPDYLGLPYLPDAWHVYLDGEQALIRQTKYQGMTVDIAQLVDMLQMGLQATGVKMPAEIVIDYDDANEHFDDESVEDISVPVNIAEQHSFGMDLMQQGLQAEPVLNLLTGEFAVQKSKSKLTVLWRWVGIAFAAWFAVWLVGSIGQYYILNKRAQNVEQQISVLYKQIFPQAQSVNSPRIRIQQALKNGGTTSGNTLLTLLSLVGQEIKQIKSSVIIKNISFRDGTLSLDVSANDFQQLANLSKALQQKSVSVQQQNASTQGKTVTARLVIKGAGNG